MYRIGLCVILVVSLSSVPLQAGPVVWNTYWNFDVVNNTGAWPNDFHVELSNVSPDQVSDYYTEDGWTVAESGGSGATNVDWTSASTVAPGQTVHFGMGFNDNPDITGVNMNWTRDGGNVGSAIPARSKWIVREGGSWDIDSTVWNDFGAAVWIQRRVNTSALAITLDDLQVTDPLWNTGTLIDSAPIRLTPGQASPVYTWIWQESTPSYLMMYEVYSENPDGSLGPLEATWLTGAVVLPEPATGILLLALCGLATLRARP